MTNTKGIVNNLVGKGNTVKNILDRSYNENEYKDTFDVEKKV